MAYLLDTCTISEMVSVKPNAKVLKWFEFQSEQTLYLSIITIGEIEKGIYQLVQSKKRLRLETWLFDELVPSFQGRILEINRKLITTWAKMTADLKTKGIIRPSFDSLIEAAALHHQLILVTRNVKNFQKFTGDDFKPVGRLNRLDRVKLGLIDYEGKLLLSSYNK